MASQGKKLEKEKEYIRFSIIPGEDDIKNYYYQINRFLTYIPSNGHCDNYKKYISYSKDNSKVIKKRIKNVLDIFAKRVKLKKNNNLESNQTEQIIEAINNAIPYLKEILENITNDISLEYDKFIKTKNEFIGNRKAKQTNNRSSFLLDNLHELMTEELKSCGTMGFKWLFKKDKKFEEIVPLPKGVFLLS